MPLSLSPLKKRVAVVKEKVSPTKAICENEMYQSKPQTQICIFEAQIYSFLLSVMEDLKLQGVKEKDILYLNLDKRGYRKIKTPDALENAIKALITDDDYKYLFIDEVQNVDGFEEVINGFREDGNFSIFIIGSNSLFGRDDRILNLYLRA